MPASCSFPGKCFRIHISSSGIGSTKILRFLVCSVCCICSTRLRLIDWCTNWNERPTGVIVASSCSLSIINKHNFTSLGLLPFTSTSNLFPTSYSSSNFQSISGTRHHIFPVLTSFRLSHASLPASILVTRPRPKSQSWISESLIPVSRASRRL